MRKEVVRFKFNLLRLTIVVVVGFLFFLVPGKTYAQEYCDYGNMPNWMHTTIGFCKITDAHEGIDTVSTGANFIQSNIIEGPAIMGFNGDSEKLGACGYMEIGDRLNAINIDISEIQGAGGRGLIDPDDIQSARDSGTVCDLSNNSYDASSSGSLIGITQMAFDTVVTEAPPVNLAYYFKHNLQKIPVINQTAYAQTPEYGGFGLELTLRIWEKTRNIAYAMMSVILLIIGILIITRKKINPQTVVTVQTALPRVLISLFLISFSYPLGALFVSAMLPLAGMAVSIVVGAYVDDWTRLADTDLLIAYFAIVVAVLGSGFVGLLIGIVMIITTMIVLLISLFKIMLINAKMILQIIIAPIQFAIASIPGQEALIGDWFKQMIAKTLSVPAIFFMIALSWYFLLAPFSDPDFARAIFFMGSPAIVQFGWRIFGGVESMPSTSTTITMIALPIIALAIMFFAIRADKTVESFVLGDKKRR